MARIRKGGAKLINIDSQLTIKRNSEIQDDKFQEDDQVLVQRAREGDPDAFGILVTKYRAKAYGWVKNMTVDTFLAEDIVQDALLNAFLRLSDLVHPSRFGPWLHRIVQNQANMRLRRGGYFGKEMPFTSVVKVEKESLEVDWSNLDNILFRLEQSVEKQASSNPMEIVVRKETISGIKELVLCLTIKERQVFEAFFFEQLPPAEIAKLLDTKVSNVYNLISRSKVKVQNERIRVHINQYVQNRRKSGLRRKTVLDKSKLIW
jgi:RNA polymerase sigma factor (sigma-70 family)